MARVRVGRVARAVGIAGWIGIEAEGEALLAAREIWLGERRFEVERAERRTKGIALKLAGVADRTAAEKLRGQEVAMDRHALPGLAEGEHYAVDLVGKELYDRTAGKVVGKVQSVTSIGGADLLVVEGGRMIPFVGAYQPRVEGERIEMTLPEGFEEL